MDNRILPIHLRTFTFVAVGSHRRRVPTVELPPVWSQVRGHLSSEDNKQIKHNLKHLSHKRWVYGGFRMQQIFAFPSLLTCEQNETKPNIDLLMGTTWFLVYTLDKWPTIKTETSGKWCKSAGWGKRIYQRSVGSGAFKCAHFSSSKQNKRVNMPYVVSINSLESKNKKKMPDRCRLWGRIPRLHKVKM